MGPDCGSEFTDALGKVKKIKRRVLPDQRQSLSVISPKEEEGKGNEESALGVRSTNPPWIFPLQVGLPSCSLWWLYVNSCDMMEINAVKSRLPSSQSSLDIKKDTIIFE